VAQKQTVADYIELIQPRGRLIRGVSSWIDNFNIMLIPTTPIIAPTFNEVERDRDFSRG
jgi:hypothetical protein